MAVFIHKNGIVIGQYKRFSTVGDFLKHHPNVDKNTVAEGQAVAGQLWDGKKLSNPVIIHLVTKDNVNSEAKRRIHLLLGAVDEQSSNEKQDNLRSEYSELQDVLIDGGVLTDEQAKRRKQIQDGNAMLKAIRVASNVLTDMSPIPIDFESHEIWPKAGK